MLLPRLIPCLLVHDGGLVKTVGFSKPTYVGDPINVVRIFNEKEVDELIVLDIDATAQRREPNYHLISQLASECHMPICYGGGVKTAEQVQRIVALGVEKVALSSAALDAPDVVSRAAERVGSQSVVVVLDIKAGSTNDRGEVRTHNGTRVAPGDPIELARRMADLGAGELVINSIDRDGRMNGYDLEIMERLRAAVTIPITALGGAGSLGDVGALVRRCGTVGASAGSLFVFKGVYRAVLVNYPRPAEKTALMTESLAGRRRLEAGA